MASTDARPVPKKNVAYRHYYAIRKNDGTLITTWAGQDSELSKDGGGFSDATNEATEIGTSGCGYIDLTSAEMNYDAVILKVSVSNTDALVYVVTFFPEEAGDIRTDVTQLGSDSQSATDLKDFADAGYDPATNKVQGVVLCDTTTTNSDMYSSVMRGTDSAFLAASAPANFSSLGINGSGHVSRVTLVDTTTTNTDMYSSVMRGTDSAFLAASAPTNFGDLAITASAGEVSVKYIATSAQDNIATVVWDKDISTVTSTDQAGYLLQRLTNYPVGSLHTDSVFGQIMWNAIGGSEFDRTTDSLQAIRDRGDSAWTTSALAAADVWAVGSRTLTANTNLNDPTAATIADTVLGRDIDNVESTAPEHSLCTTILAMLESSVSGSVWTIKRTNGTTHATKTVTSGTADPITGVS